LRAGQRRHLEGEVVGADCRRAVPVVVCHLCAPEEEEEVVVVVEGEEEVVVRRRRRRRWWWWWWRGRS